MRVMHQLLLWAAVMQVPLCHPSRLLREYCTSGNWIRNRLCSWTPLVSLLPNGSIEILAVFMMTSGKGALTSATSHYRNAGNCENRKCMMSITMRAAMESILCRRTFFYTHYQHGAGLVTCLAQISNGTLAFDELWTIFFFALLSECTH